MLVDSLYSVYNYDLGGTINYTIGFKIMTPKLERGYEPRKLTDNMIDTVIRMVNYMKQNSFLLNGDIWVRPGERTKENRKFMFIEVDYINRVVTTEEFKTLVGTEFVEIVFAFTKK